jgi:hypothetical protein
MLDRWLNAQLVLQHMPRTTAVLPMEFMQQLQAKVQLQAKLQS